MEYAKSLESAKVGEVVFDSVLVRIGFSAGDRFYLPVVITGITKTLIKVGDRSFSKSTGNEKNVKNDYLSGVKCKGAKGWRPVVDQTVEYKAAVEFTNKLSNAKAALDEIHIKLRDANIGDAEKFMTVCDDIIKAGESARLETENDK